MTASPFASEYDVASRRAVRPRGRDFELVITPRYEEHYVVETYEALTADLLRSVIILRRLFVDVGAHSGFFTLLAATTNRDVQVVALPRRGRGRRSRRGFISPARGRGQGGGAHDAKRAFVNRAGQGSTTSITA
jgi:hypothetical protein